MKQEDYKDSPAAEGMEAFDATDVSDLSPRFETRSEPSNRPQKAEAVALVISVLLLVAGCMVFRRGWSEWPSQPACQPDWVSARSRDSVP